MTAFTLALLALLVPMLVISVVNLTLAPRLHRVPPATAGPRVSVLIPARDEAANLRRLLPALADTGYAAIEFLVLDDGSTDETAAVVRKQAAADPRFRLLEGLDPPPGWLGKTWACHQLAHQATGDLLVFCDADVEPGPDAVGRTAALLAPGHADVATAFPRHEGEGWLVRALVPLLTQLPIGALLPLPLVPRTRTVSLAAGNGQWLAWRRDAYRALGGHARVRDDVLEDVRLARTAKAAGLRLAAVVAPRDLTVRMYGSGAAAWEGFGKNLYLLAGGTSASALAVLALFLLTMGAPLVLPFVPGAGAAAWTPLALLVAVRTANARLFRHGGATVLLHPLGVPVAAALMVASRRRHRTGRVAWKRRTLNLEKLA